MMITIHGLPTNIKYQDLKAVIKQECNITDFILDNLLPEGKDFKKVRVGLANDSEGNYVMKCLNGYRFSGHILQVTAVGKSGEFQSQQNAFSDQGRVDPWNNQSLWSGTQQHQSQYAYHNQPINTDGPSNVMNQSARSQYDQRTAIIDRVGPPSQGLSISLKNAPTQTGTQVREGLLRTVQVIDTSRNAPQRQNSYSSHNRPAAINKDNYQGRQYNATQQNLGHYQEQTWAQQEQQSKHQRMVYENPSQDKRGPVKDTSNDVSFKEKHQFQARAQEMPQERTDSNRRNVQPIDVHMSRRFPSPNYRPLSPDISLGRSYAAESPSYRLDSPNTQQISPFGIAPSRSMGIGRPGSPSRRRPSPGIKVLPTGRGQGHIASRKDDERVVPRHHDVIHTTPSKVTGKERFSPTRNFVDTRVAKPIRPAYDSRSDSNQASYSGGFRPNENIHYPSKGREERPDPWSNRVSEHNTSHCEERRDMRRMPKFEVPRSIEHSRLIENEVKRSSSRNRESRSPRRDRSPIRDRFKRHSPSPRSPRRSWALEKRRSPEDTDVPPPPTWPCQDHNAIKDIRGKRKPYPVQVENNRGPTWDMNKYDPTPDDRREIRPNADDRRPFERGSIAVRKDLEKWKPIGTDSPKLSPPRYKPEENERALRRREIDTRHQDHRMPDAEQKRPERALEHRRGDARPYKSDFTDASELSKIKEELTRRIEKKTEILKKQEELQKEIEDVYKRAADFTKKVEYRKGDRRHDDYKEQGRRDNPDPKEFDLPTLTFLKEERRERYYEDGRPEEKGKISRHEESRADDEKRTKACEAITDKILEKFGGMLPRDVTFRVKKEMNFAVKKILKRIFGDQDVSFIEMIIKFKAKHSTKDEEDIYDSILSGFPNQYRNLKRPAKGEAFLPAEVAAKISKPSPVSNVETVEAAQSYEPLNWNYSYSGTNISQMPSAFMAPQYMIPFPTFVPTYNVPHSVGLENTSDNDGYSLFLCKDNFQTINEHEANLLKDYVFNEIVQLSQQGRAWSPNFTFKGLQSPFRYEVVTRDIASRDWLLGVDFSKLPDFNVLVYTREELWYERAAIWLPGHSRSRIEPLDKLKLQNKSLESINISKWKLVKKVITERGTRVYVDMPPSSARVLEVHNMLLSYELQKVNVFLKAVAVDKDAFDAGLKETFSTNANAQCAMPSLPNDANAVKFCVKGDKPVSHGIAGKIKHSIVYHLFKYLQSGGTSRTDFTKHGYMTAGYFGVVAENSESKHWLTSVQLGFIRKQPITVVCGDGNPCSFLTMFIVLPGDKLVNPAMALERLRVSNQGVKGINFNKWRKHKMLYHNVARKSTYEVEMDLESIDRIASLKYQLDYVVDGVENVVDVNSQYPEATLLEIIRKHREENSDKYDEANMELSSGSESDNSEVLCLD